MGQKSIKNPSTHTPFVSFLLPKYQKNIYFRSVWNLGDNTAKNTTRQNEHFQNFELDIKIFLNILKPPAELQKVPSYAVDRQNALSISWDYPFNPG
jgi:hypothetical protein